ncbi:ethanolamine ammonia-lyase subunit EutC [Paenibacillus sp. UNC451MF]|uniref:ethanolamine ammonia-lyase subunit EutC n=1 Tax=Paenibacillus sp. UNC451MF TaxID=1449063 RepID=UPI000A4FD478|nr:ethanolamine ammonia-lyase subunit EutC [Paenibacillus sp. UNC451MF]
MNRTIPLEQLVDQVMAQLEKRKLLEEIAPPRDGLASSRDDTLNGRPDTKEPVDTEVTGFAGRADDEVVGSHIPQPRWKEGIGELLSSTPSRLGVWRTGTRPLTKEMLKFRCDHAAAVDSIYGEVSPLLLESFGLFQVETHYENTDNYLKRPDRGRVIIPQGVNLIRTKCKMNPQVQVVISDGLSANAIDANLPDVYPSLLDSIASYGLSAGTPFFVRGGRVAVMDHIGELLQPEVLVLLIGERPGLVSSKSMSAYMCYRPRKGTVESERTVISNIHRGGTPPVEAGAHIGTLLKKMLEQQASGVNMEL